MQEKHSLSIAGHRSSVTLEPEFWRAFKQLASDRGLSVNELATEIDAARAPGTNLSSALRLAVLAALQAQLSGA